MNTYCYKVESKGVVNVDLLKKALEGLYRRTGGFGAEEALPFLIIYSDKNGTVCIKMKSVAKKNIERIEGIHAGLTAADLILPGSIKLGVPYLIEKDVCGTLNKDCLVKRGGRAWETLVHNGPYFGHIYDPYIPHKTPILYDGKPYVLTPEEEKIANFYAARIITDRTATVAHTTNPLFNTNFWYGFKTSLTPEHAKIFKDFTKFDFSPFVATLESQKLTKAEVAEKERRKIAAAERELNYSYAIINGVKEKLGGVAVEPAGIFLGRGANPKLGMIKKDVYPEDVIINVGEGIVVDPPPGHKWKDVVHDHNVTWLASWKDTFGENKYIRAGSQGQFKSNSDLIKYETARKLNEFIDPVRAKYTADYTNGTPVMKQLGTVLYLIDNFGLRVGGEKDDATEADTVGASTLRVEHVRVVPPETIVFDFLGKDSVRFYKELKTNPVIARNISTFLTGKAPGQQLFDLISAADINAYLKSFDKDFTAKVFRTRLASSTMDASLKGLNVKKGDSQEELKKQFNKANAVVAELLNHQRAVTAKARDTVAKYRTELATLEEELTRVQATGKSTAAIEKKITTKRNQIELKDETLHIALTTSLTNYIDPRIVVSWTKRHELAIPKVYPAKLQKVFKWAIDDTPEDWDYTSTPLLPGFTSLEPAGASASTTKMQSAVKVTGLVTRPTTPQPAKPAASAATTAVATIPIKTRPAGTTPPQPTIQPASVPTIVDYTASSIAVIGDTKPYAEQFTTSYGRYNPNLIVNGVKTPGWIFSTKRRGEIQTMLGQTPPPAQIPVLTRPPSQTPVLTQGEPMIVDNYTAASFVVIGDTKPYSDRFTASYGRYNPNLIVNGVKTPGWIFSKKRLPEIQTMIKTVADAKDAVAGEEELLSKFTLTAKEANIIKCFARNPKVVQFLKEDMYDTTKVDVYNIEYLRKFMTCLDEASEKSTEINWQVQPRDVIVETILRLLAPSTVSTFTLLIYLLYKSPRREEYLNELVAHLSDTAEIELCLCNNFSDIKINSRGGKLKLLDNGNCTFTDV